ncbi:MAG: WD40 repeat domain-containing protein [Gemmataceae bacterium]|nr:WD40 repeat domain-containing protein [Gemmataceae bacterium]
MGPQLPVIAPVQRLRSHVSDVSCLAFSPDGQWLASGSKDKTIKFWDMPKRVGIGHLLTVLGNTVSLLAFSPDSKWLAASCWDGTASVTDVRTGRLISSLDGHGGPVNGVAFMPDGKRVVTCGDDGNLYVWDAATGERIFGEGLQCGRLLHLSAFPGPFPYVVVASQHHILLMDIDQQKVLWDGSVIGGWNVAVAPDLEHVAAAGSRGRVFIWDRGPRVFTRDATSIVAGHGNHISAVAFSPDSTLLATAGDDRRVVIRRVDTKKPVAECQGHDGAVHDVAFSPDGTTLATGGEDETICLWDLKDLPASEA